LVDRFGPRYDTARFEAASENPALPWTAAPLNIGDGASRFWGR
jgi:hypothetical protein